MIGIRLREELGGTSIVEWKAECQLVFRTLALALDAEPGMVCSRSHPDMPHADMPGGLGEFRVSSLTFRPHDPGLDVLRGACTLEALPTVLRSGPYRIFFYSADRDEPPHVHVERDESEAKFWLDPVRLEGSRGFTRMELRRLEALVGENGAFLVRAWLEYFGD